MKWVAISPNGDLVWNDGTQGHSFPSRKAAEAAAKEELDEPEGEDLDTGRIHTTSDETGWGLKDYRFFREDKRG